MGIADMLSGRKKEESSKGSSPIDKAKFEATADSKGDGEGKKKPGRRTLGGKPKKSTLEDDLERLMSPENMRPILRAPADLMYLKTGRELWNIPDNELDPLCHTASMTGKYFCKFDPKWLSLVMFMYSVGLTYGSRIVENAKQNREEMKSKQPK